MEYYRQKAPNEVSACVVAAHFCSPLTALFSAPTGLNPLADQAAINVQFRLITRFVICLQMVSDYNAFAKVGGAKLWMTIDTSTSTSWVMSMACFMLGCQKVEIFAGGFLPALPPGPFPIDLLEAGIFQILSMVGMNGHTMTNAGSSIMGTPVMIGILDLGHINPNVFNHSGTLGLGELVPNGDDSLLVPLSQAVSIQLLVQR